MRDENLHTPPDLSPAESAVLYLLERVRVDADLRWHLLNTEAFARLCAAEAQRTGRTAEEVEAHYSQSAPHRQDAKPRLLQARRLLEQIADLARDGAEIRVPPAVACQQIADLAEESP